MSPFAEQEACRGCGGTGIDAEVSPRAAAAALVPLSMRRAGGLIDGGGTTNVCRIAVQAQIDRGRMKFYGPLRLVIEHIEHRLRDGYEIVQGDAPDPALACQWCNGFGSPDGQLTLRALERHLTVLAPDELL